MTRNVKYSFTFLVLPILIGSVWILSGPEEQDSTESDGLVRSIRIFLKNGVSTFKSQFYGVPPPEAYMSTPQLINYHGYPVEEHHVTTADGYILTLHRIPRGKKMKRWRKEPVVIQHGILCSSSDWLLPGLDSIPFLLADQGFEVWLGNSRGSNYSLQHTTLHQNDVKFWDFGVDEIGGYDVPAIIDHVLKTSNAEKLNWIGHSMGCTMVFVAINQNPSLNDKINRMVAYAPAVYHQNVITPFFRLTTMMSASTICWLTNTLAGGRFLPPSVTHFLREYGPSFCSGKISAEFCNMQHFLFTGFSRGQTTEKTAPFVAGHMPSETAGKTLAHYAQFIQEGIFRAYDYGEKKNINKYNSSSPPLYHLSKVKVPILGFYGLNDWLATPVDARKTMSELGNVKGLVQIADENWNHLDFLYGKDAREFVYRPSIQFLES